MYSSLFVFRVPYDYNLIGNASKHRFAVAFSRKQFFFRISIKQTWFVEDFKDSFV